jgi:hypothetical protein
MGIMINHTKGKKENKGFKKRKIEHFEGICENHMKANLFR